LVEGLEHNIVILNRSLCLGSWVGKIGWSACIWLARDLFHQCSFFLVWGKGGYPISYSSNRTLDIVM